VKVAAGNAFHQLMVSASIAVGESAWAGAVTVGVVTLNTDAYIDNSANVHTAKDVIIDAHGHDTIVSVAAAGGGGVVGVAGAVSVIVLHNHTFANTGTNVTITADNNVLVNAQDDTKLIVVAGGVAADLLAWASAWLSLPSPRIRKPISARRAPWTPRRSAAL